MKVIIVDMHIMESWNSTGEFLLGHCWARWRPDTVRNAAVGGYWFDQKFLDRTMVAPMWGCRRLEAGLEGCESSVYFFFVPEPIECQGLKRA